MENSQQLLSGMDAEEAIALFSESVDEYRITWECSQEEAERRQQEAGNGEVVEDGYARKTASDYFADVAGGDSEASVEVVK